MNVGELMRREVTTIDEGESLGLALQLMGWNGIRHLPVMRDGRVVGMLSQRDVLARARPEHREHVEGTVGAAMSTPLHVAPPHMDTAEAAAIMVRERVDALPVVDAGTLVGIVTTTDLLGHAAQCEISPPPTEEPTVGSLMIRNVEAAFADDPLTDAAGRMVARGIRHLPVVDGMMRVTGILSERDVREATGRALLEVPDAERASYVQRLRVGDVMTPDPRTIGEDEPLSTAVRALVEDRFGALPVVDDGERLRGILSYVDLLRYLGARLAADAS
jgi:CBS domain-containing protein